MRLGQTRVNGAVTAALFDDGETRIIAGHTALDVIAGVVPKLTAVVPLKPEPRMTTTVPPTGGPNAGLMPVMPGAVAKLN